MGCEGSFRAASVGLLVGMAAAAIFIIMFNEAVDGEQSLGKYLFNSTTYLNLKYDEDLQHLLERVANGDKTVILTMVNWAWAAPNSLLDLFIESFHNGEEINHLLKHLLIIALDTRAFDRCKLLNLHCYLLKVESSNSNITSAQQFLSKGYVKLLWNRVKLQGQILELGYNFILTDVDVLWFRNPFKHIAIYADMAASCDYYKGDPDDINNNPNMGFVFYKSSNRTINMMQYWYEARKRYPSTYHEQNVFYYIKKEIVDSLGVRMQFIDTKFCGGFCSHEKELSEICTMHANCCYSLEDKIHDLTSLRDDWKNYTALSEEGKKTKGDFAWRVPGKCIS